MPNRLASEMSPYLQQHSRNPVDWYPWCKEAIEKARRENLPIFLSIGYSSCHWCHVMEKEVFEDQAIAEYLNARMVSIKVDREERPDLDRYFQEIFQIMNRRAGGWPLSVFLTPSLKPFHAATYIPPLSSLGITGFVDLIRIIHDMWQNRPETLEKGGAQVIRQMETFRDQQRQEMGPVPDDIAGRFLEQASSLYEPEYGGFSRAPKFPSPSILNMLMDISLLPGNQRAGEMAFHTMKCMARGGLYDLVDGGFCRYSVDDRWLVPHFEKMTCDNALLCESYTRAWKITGQRFFLDIARETALFMLEKMQDKDLFFSASDADSEGEEGKYFVYSREQVVQALVENAGFTRDLAGQAASELSITDSGNFEGMSIVRLRCDERPSWYEPAISALRDIRRQRAYPFIDRKVITSWNAMMIKSLFLVGESDGLFLKKALQCLDSMLSKMFKGDRLYHCALADTDPTTEAFLEDYAFLLDALLTAHEATSDVSWLNTAAILADFAIKRFYDNGAWLFGKMDFPVLSESSDASYPSSSAVMVSVLIRLGRLLNRNSYTQIAAKSISVASGNISRYPVNHGMFVKNALSITELNQGT